MLLVSISYSD